jgi:hypothetical protein
VSGGLAQAQIAGQTRADIPLRAWVRTLEACLNNTNRRLIQVKHAGSVRTQSGSMSFDVIDTIEFYLARFI